MKRFFKPIALLFCLAALASCQKKGVDPYVEPVIDNPIADYDIVVDPTDAMSFSFKNKTTNFKRLEWRFGDDTLTTVENPTHTYLAPGKYTVDMKAFSKTTSASTRKLIDINIIADSLLSLTSVRTITNPADATLQFTCVAKVPVAKIVWQFTDQGQSATTETYATNATKPTRKYNSGTFNEIKVTVTTTKGSVITIVRNATTEGIAEDITQKRIDYAVTLENGLNPANKTANEGSSKLLDNNLATKFGVYGQGSNIKNWAFTIKFGSPVLVKLYCIANANDSKNTRDPKMWNLEGSNDEGLTWSLLATEQNGTGFYDKATNAGITVDGTANSPGRYFRRWYYTVPSANQKPFSWIRLSFPEGSFGNDAIQLAEFNLYR